MRPGDRSLFPDLSFPVYTNHAAVGPLPKPARDAMVAAVDAQAARGVACVPELAESANRVRDRFAELVGAQAADVALTGNTSDGVIALAHSIAWKPGDRILLFEGEFPTNTTPWQVAAKLYGVEIVWLPADRLRTDEGLNAVEDLCREGLRLIAVSAVQFQTGLRMPVAALTEIAHRHGAEIFVDAIQAVGGVPFTMGEADYLTCGGQKWLLGPIGTGVIVVRPDKWAGLTPRLASWLSHIDPLAFLFGAEGALTYDRPLASGPSLFEGGTRNFAGHLGLSQSLRILLEVGMDATFAHTQAYIDALESGLAERGFRSQRAEEPSRRSSILSLRPPTGVASADLSATLGEHGVATSTPDGLLRFSPSWPNGLGEVPMILAAVDAALEA